MNYAAVIAEHGKALGATGLAVLVAFTDYPGATYAEVARMLDMGESTVKRDAAMLERLGLAKREPQKTDNGLAQPTKVYPATIYRGASDKPRQDISPAITYRDTDPAIRETAEEIKENAPSHLSDPATIYRGTSGTEVAPLRLENTSTEDTQPSVEAGADAPPARPPKTKKARASKADPRTSHPAIVAVFEVTGRRPDKDLYNKIIRTLGEDPDGQKLVECFEAWRGKGYRATNYAWITEWYVKGIPEKALNGDGKHGQRQSNPRTDTIRDYDYSVFDGAEGEGAGNFDSQVPPDEWVAAPADGRPDGDDRRVAGSSRH